ncbi:restriction endonuclease subunit S [Pseudomonas aeruginosa]|uniref:restriction endonuclease subunit S n=1 Tax=Pseudomonas TaxID=286 RepID=UPI0004B4C806|nr:MULTISPECIES: restriction endonuclease subunit S [Pseudomonas]MBH9455372.1 restriction endonuclease subunit S [Pseudomonas aeruginosa]MBH9462231.1 restriction endonuclease subunit S [Pseudomonas aeruginosa]MDI3610792.1 restriction endonuclease subunit S [Pseudomonas aeruginosa]MDI3677707.1 restriction endonuclease subunit S [Pseudomonas aeruginosa]MDI3708027.1 restriction endonuclease subunit S [Pseudomonas aeruginosa]
MKQVSLSDKSHFQLVSGLWKGKRAPLKPAKVLRATNFGGDGLLDFEDVVELDVEERHFAERQLAQGDIVVERSGGGPKQPVGRIALFVPPDERPYFSSNFTTTLRVRDRDIFDPDYVALYLHALYLGGATETLQRATTGIRNLDWHEYLRFEVPVRSLDEQKELVQLIGGVRKAYRVERELVEVLAELKCAAMTHLFTRGLRGEAQKETEIGLVPESWDVTSLGAHHTVVSGGTPSRSNPTFWTGGTIPWVKTTEVDYCVINETGEHITPLALECSAAKMLPVGTLLMAMYGQGVTRGKVAILGIEATCNQACAAITPKDDAVLPRYLYHFLTWRYDEIRSLAHGGQQQNLNLEIVRDLPLTYPKSEDEQREIVAILDTLDRKIDLHRKKRAVLEELFQSLLHKLMTGEIRVADLDLSALPVAPAQTPEVTA